MVFLIENGERDGDSPPAVVFHQKSFFGHGLPLVKFQPRGRHFANPFVVLIVDDAKSD